MSEYQTCDLLIEAIDEEPGGPLTKEGVELVRKGWEQGQTSVQPEITTLRQQLANSEVRVAELERDNAHQRERRNAARDCIQKMKAESFHKQAEAVEDIRKDLLSDLPDHRVSRQVDIRLGLRVNSLREKAEKAGGE